MRYWWVNQNQTYNEEVSGGYIWSPKRNKNGARNQFYENMRAVSPGDLIFSFRNTHISTLGRATSNCYDAPKPAEFGALGANWDQHGWKVDVKYKQMVSPIRPKDEIDRIGPLLPDKYSPLQHTGDGNQGVYLAEVPYQLAMLLMELLKNGGSDVAFAEDPVIVHSRRSEDIESIENAIEAGLQANVEIDSTTKAQLISARRGQGKFRANVLRLEKECRITKVDDPQFLIASHIKPWRDSSNEERLDGENGLMLSPNVDLLFDEGFISFEDAGLLLISPVVDMDCLRRLGVPVDSPFSVGNFTSKQREYLAHHRQNIFLEAGK